MAIVSGSSGTIRTMAGDLALEKGEQPRKIEVPQAPPAPAPSGPPPLKVIADSLRQSANESKQATEPPPPTLSQKSLEELLPLEEPSGATREETIRQTKTMPQQRPQQEDASEREPHRPTTPPPPTPPRAQPAPPPSPQPPAPPARPAKFPQTQPASNAALKEEVFPAPDIKKDFTKPPPPPPNLPGVREEKEQKNPQEIDTDTEIPTETPEELLGIGGDSVGETTPPARPAVGETPAPPPAGGPSGAMVDGSMQTKKGFNKTPDRKKASSSRRFIMIGGAILVALLIGGGIFYYTTSQPNEIPPAPQPPPSSGGSLPQTIFIPPAPLIIPDFIQEIIVENFAQETIMEALKTLALNEYPQQSITYLPIRLSQTTPENKSIYLDAPTFFASLNIETPQGMLDVIEKQFMLYIYGPSEQEQAFCEAGGITDETCWGPRLGFVLQGPQILLGVFLSQWAAPEIEGEWEKSNLYRLILSGAKSVPEDPSFTTGPEYQGLTIDSPRTINISYVNLPISTMTFDFAMIDEFFVFATSKNALFLMLDKIIQK